MKKFILATITVAALSANAMEVGLNTFETATSGGQHGLGVTLGGKVQGLNLTGGFSHAAGNRGFDRYTATVGKNFVKEGNVTLGGQVGAAYINNLYSKDGAAVTAGLGASVALSEKVSLGATIDHQFGSNSVAHSKGNILAAGVKVGF